MTAAAFDTNVLVNGLTSANSVPSRLIPRWADADFELVVSDYILSELRAAFEKRYFQQRFPPEHLRAQVERIARNARVIEISETVVGVAAHLHDDPVLATAVSAGGPCLVTGDRELRALNSFRGVAILTPREVLAVLDADRGA